MTDEVRINNGNSDPVAQATAERIMGALYPEIVISELADGVVSGTGLFFPQPEHQGAPGWMQGGLSSTVLDYACARMASAALESKVVTGTLDLRYRQPVPLDGGPYRVAGSTDEPRARTIRVKAAILSDDGRALVEADSLFISVAGL